MKSNIIITFSSLVILLGVPSLSLSLATVESRTGAPVVRFPAETETNIDFNSGGASEDRAARLTLKQITVLTQEVSDLRGLVETQQHEIERLKKSQQDFYVDLDKRLSQLQKNPVVMAVAPKGETKPVAKGSAVTVVPTVKTKTTTEKEAYDAAYNFMRTKQYPEAIVAFQDYLTRFGTGEHAPNAHYWLGEVFMVQWQTDKTEPALLDKAAEAFLNVTSQFPTHPKVADALLKLGLVANEKGDFEAAKQYLGEVKEQYPNSTAARIAEIHLQQLN